MLLRFLYLAFCAMLRLLARCRCDIARDAELLVLRHELAVLRRGAPSPGFAGTSIWRGTVGVTRIAGPADHRSALRRRIRSRPADDLPRGRRRVGEGARGARVVLVAAGRHPRPRRADAEADLEPARDGVGRPHLLRLHRHLGRALVAVVSPPRGLRDGRIRHRRLGLGLPELDARDPPGRPFAPGSPFTPAVPGAPAGPISSAPLANCARVRLCALILPGVTAPSRSCAVPTLPLGRTIAATAAPSGVAPRTATASAVALNTTARVWLDGRGRKRGTGSYSVRRLEPRRQRRRCLPRTVTPALSAPDHDRRRRTIGRSGGHLALPMVPS